MAEKKHRLVLTSEELEAIKNALYKFVIDGCEKPYLLTGNQLAIMPTAADVLLTHFGG